MTGFARSSGSDEHHRWAWEIRSVNGKGLDIRCRLPPGCERLEPHIRERCTSRFTRGNIQVSLSVGGGAATTRIRINDQVLTAVLDAMRKIGTRLKAGPPSLDGILSIRGVVEVDDAEPDEAVVRALDAALLEGLDAALSELAGMRQGEGDAVGEILATRLGEIERLVTDADASPGRTVDAIRARLAEQVAALLDAAPALDPDRLHQEAVLLATKADIREELDRLAAHIAAARQLLGEGGAVGRRLDFLAQEFNREVNTLCAKSHDRSLTALGLEMKAAIDQMREQIQNLE